MLSNRTLVLISNTEPFVLDWQFEQQINPGSSLNRLDHELGPPVLNVAVQPAALSSQVTIWTESTVPQLSTCETAKESLRTARRSLPHLS